MNSLVAHQVTAENWRIVCTCQRHRSSHSLFEVRQLRGPFAAIIITGSIVLLGTTFPSEAMNIRSLELKLSLGPSSAAPIQVKAILATPAELANGLHLVTNRLKQEFLNPPDEKTLIRASIQEEFFRSEVPFGAIIYREARSNGLPPELVAAIVETESDFRPTLLSSKNAQGLMQLMPSTGVLMGAIDLFNPNDNVRAGTRYLRYLQHRFTERDMVLAAYNAGESIVRKYGGIPPYPETQNFVKRVARRHDRYQQRVAERVAMAENLRTALGQ